MPKRKYTRMKEQPKGYECCNKKCKWQGQIADQVPVEVVNGFFDHACPKCGKFEFYGLIENPIK
ncbi:hypothetical protein [Flavobacterium sp. 14A]|uniref:hypothetical protein n=1 Tax=Flavobacterium sp. 14A TaxID=2735896 RepID=UPI00156F546E|nr:hypothetical protein [Flavobacterium sp. 14A]NRT11507.1 hypothetical protein [Flavobacterium sp. 14A]